MNRADLRASPTPAAAAHAFEPIVRVRIARGQAMRSVMRKARAAPSTALHNTPCARPPQAPQRSKNHLPALARCPAAQAAAWRGSRPRRAATRRSAPALPSAAAPHRPCCSVRRRSCGSWRTVWLAWAPAAARWPPRGGSSTAAARLAASLRQRPQPSCCGLRREVTQMARRPQLRSKIFGRQDRQGASS